MIITIMIMRIAMMMMMIVDLLQDQKLCDMKVGVAIYAFTSSFNVLFSIYPATTSWHTGSAL